MKKNDFVGTKQLIKLALRRDRVKLPVWLLSIFAVIGVIAAAYKEFSVAEIKDMIIMASASPGMRLLVAPISSEAVGEMGTFFLFRMSFLIAILIAIMNIQILIRHTRQNEETGCTELIASTVTGRYANLSAAVIIALAANAVLSFLIALALIGNGFSTVGSFAAGMSFGFFGIVFAAIAAVTAQLLESSRGASALAFGALAATFMINALGNVMGTVNAAGMGYESAWPVWLSPLGWIQQIHAYDKNNWWILLLFAALFTILIFSAFTLVNRRDVGRGMLSSRPGPATAPRSLLSPLGLAWRLQRGTLIGWAVPIAIFSIVFGASSQEFGDTIEGMEMFQAVLEASADAFSFMLIGIVAVIISIYTIQSLLRKRSEESEGHLEAVLATSVSRIKWMASHIFCSVIGTAALLIIFGFGLALSSGATADRTLDLIKFSLYQGAGIIVIAGFATAVFALFPRKARVLSWLAVMISILAGPFFGALMDIPQNLQKLSPFTYVGLLLSEVKTDSVIVLLVVGLGLGIVGLTGFNRRDISM